VAGTFGLWIVSTLINHTPHYNRRNQVEHRDVTTSYPVVGWFDCWIGPTVQNVIPDVTRFYSVLCTAQVVELSSKRGGWSG